MDSVQASGELTDLGPSLRDWVILLKRLTATAATTERLLNLADEEYFG